MALEIDSIDDYGLDYGYSSPNYMQPPESRFHNAIFSSANYDERFSRKPVFDTNRLPLDGRIETVFMNSSGAENTMFAKGKGKGGKASGQVEGKVEWGGKDGPKYGVGASGKVEDKNGNYVKGKVKQSDDGKGSVKVAAGNEKNKAPNKDPQNPKKN